MPTNAETNPWVSPKAVVAESARVYPGAWIGPEVEVGRGVTIGPGSSLGFAFTDGSRGPVRVAEGALLGPNVCVEADVTIGRDCRIGFGSLIRAGSRLREGVFVGARCTIMGNCRIEDHAFLYAEVHVCEFALLYPHCQLMPGSMLMNEPYPPTGLAIAGPEIGECAIVGAKSVVWPGVRLGYHAMVASLSEVKRDVADFLLVRGCPARPICDVRKIRLKLKDQWVYPYPWMRCNIEGEDITEPVVS